MSDLYHGIPLTERQQAIIDLLALPDPPWLSRGHHFTQQEDPIKQAKFFRQVRRAWLAYRNLEKFPEELPGPATHPTWRQLLDLRERRKRG